MSERVFARVDVVEVEAVAPRVTRVTVEGDGLRGYEPLPGDAFKLATARAPATSFEFPESAADGLPEWADPATRPILRPFAVRDADSAAGRLRFDVVAHDGARTQAVPAVGDAVAVLGMRFGYTPRPGAHQLLAADRSTLPAVAAILERLPGDTAVTAVLAVDDPAERALLPAHPGLTVEWVGDLATARPEAPAGQAWLAGEASALAPLHAHVVGTLGVPASDATVVVAWERGRTLDERDAVQFERYRAALAEQRDVTDPATVAELELVAP